MTFRRTIMSASGLILFSSLLATVMAQTPTCETTCSSQALTDSGCSSATATCACDQPYAMSMVQCLAKPDGCSYAQIEDWTQRYRTQCFLSPPIVPDCLSICPAISASAVGCSQGINLPDFDCLCSDKYLSATKDCIEASCGADQYNLWASAINNQCASLSLSGTPTFGPPPTASGTRPVPGISSTGTRVTSATPTSQQSHGSRVLSNIGVVVFITASLTYFLGSV